MSELIQESPTPLQPGTQPSTSSPPRAVKKAADDKPLAAPTEVRTSPLYVVGGIFLVAAVAFAAFFAEALSFVNPLPNCPECAACSSLKESLDSLALRWDASAASVDELNAELDVIESAISKRASSAFRSPQEADCLQSLVAKFDERLTEYTNGTIERLTGFGSSDACPKVAELLTLASRLKRIMKQLPTSMETPTCEELLQWHSQFYSCSPQ